MQKKPYSLVGVDSNAFAVMAYTINAMKDAKYSAEDIKQYQKLATSENYDNLLVRSMEWIDKCNEVLGLDKKAYNIETEAFASFGPGKYFIGDICYALPDYVYDKVWGDEHNYEDGVYNNFAVHRTAYGDGCYEGTDGVSYGVDAGVIGVTNITVEQRYTDEELKKLGKIVNIEDVLIMNCDDKGNFEFIVDGDRIQIITDGSDYEEDEEDYE